MLILQLCQLYELLCPSVVSVHSDKDEVYREKSYILQACSDNEAWKKYANKSFTPKCHRKDKYSTKFQI